MRDKVHFSKTIIDSLNSIDYWQSLNPYLTISNIPFSRNPADLDLTLVDQSRYVRQMKEDGYFKLDSVLPQKNMEKLASAITNLVNQGFPPVFIAMYDEFWQVFRDISPLASPIFGDDYRLVTNFWAWYLPANAKSAGFPPHRDIAGAPLSDNGLPWIGTVWIPLTDVTTHNACMHVLPASADPNLPNDPTNSNIPQNSIQDIRALPAPAGSVLSWNPNVLHWGSRSSVWAKAPRISIAAYLIKAGDVPRKFSNISLESFGTLTLDCRLGMIGIAMSHYDSDTITEERYPPQLIEYCKHFAHCERHETRPLRNKLTVVAEKVGRNELCPCGSSKKYKHCHGAKA